MRLKLVYFAVAALILGTMLAFEASAQNPDAMMPEQSAAKAKQILSDLRNARGGAAYNEVI